LKILNRNAIKIIFIAFLTIIYPFINIFNGLGEVSPYLINFGLTQILNYIVVLFALYIFLNNMNFRISLKIIIISSIFLATLVINYILSPYASAGWFINWCGFTFIYVTLSEVTRSLPVEDFDKLERISIKWMLKINKYFSIVVLIIWGLNISNLMEFIINNDKNSIISILHYSIGTTKQPLGIFYLSMIIFFVLHWKKLNKPNKIFILLSSIILLPSTLQIRTMWLAISLCFIYSFFIQSTIRKLTLTIIVATFFMLAFLNIDTTISIVDNNYDRFPSLKFAWSVLEDNFFGLGNGAYQWYVENNNDLLVSKFGGYYNIYTNIFWPAPESDLVYFIASWGWLSAVFFIFYFMAILAGSKLLKFNYGLNNLERYFLFMMLALIFMGISEDNAGKLVWWIFMAVGSGIIIRHLPAIRLKTD
jgi:hypothetical protein